MDNRNALQYFDAGFTALISVVPPGATISPDSKIQQKDAGKVPGRKGFHGQYVGYNWLTHRPERHEVHQWLLDGSNVGFGGWEFPAFDIDITDPVLAMEAVAAVERVLGPCVIRTGRWPKVLVVCRSDEPLQSFDIHYERDHPLLGLERYGIQFVANGKQYVMDGTHPVTGKPYTVKDPLHALDMLGPDALPTLTADNVAEVFDEIERCLTPLGFPATRKAETRLQAEEVTQERLLPPSFEELRQVVDLLPNSTPDRQDYISVGYAIKGAAQDDPELGREIFQDWCSRWEGGDNLPSQVDLDWDKMVPPYRTGYDWLVDQGRAWGAEMAVVEFGEAEEPPVIEEGEVEETAKEPPLMADPDFRDLALAEQFTKLHSGRLLLVEGLPNVVYHWNGVIWEEKSDTFLATKVTEFLAARDKYVAQLVEGDQEAKAVHAALGSHRTFTALKTKARSSERLTVQASLLDGDKDVIGTPEGCYCLKTGKLLAPDPRRLMVKSTMVAPDPHQPTPVFNRFISDAVGGDQEFLQYLQTFFGYALTGHTKEQIFPFFTGPGGNGKSLMARLVENIMGCYATQLPVEMFQQRRTGGGDNSPDYLLAKMVGARLVTTSETKSGGYWDEQRIKQLTGEDTLNARMPFGNPFSFTTQATLLVVGNHAPSLESVGMAMTRRLHIIPWNFVPKEKDDELYNKLEREAPGILAWLMEGAQRWYAEGLQKCEEVKNETNIYLEEQDVLGRWMRECVVIDPEAARRRTNFVTSRELHLCYSQWKANNGGYPMGAAKFATEIAPVLREQGAQRHRNNTTKERGWVGIELDSVDVGGNVVPFTSSEGPVDTTRNKR